MSLEKKELNPCKCGSEKYPNIDSDDMFPCWMVNCEECKQIAHSDTREWTYCGAVNAWNSANPLK